MISKTILALIAASLAVIGNVPYLFDVFRGKVVPHAYTWLVWSIVSCIAFFGQVSKGAGVGAIPTGASEVFTIIIFLFSLKYGFKHIHKSDKIFLIIALSGLIPWYFTNDATISVAIAVGIDLVAFIPTLRKTWQHPHTEHPLLYGTNAFRHLIALFSLEAYNVATMLHSLVMIIINSAMTLIIKFKKTIVRSR